MVEKASDQEPDSIGMKRSSSSASDLSKQRKIDTFFGARVSETATVAALTDAMGSASIGAGALRMSSKGFKKDDSDK